MRNSFVLPLLVVAWAGLSVASDGASANRISVSETSFRATWSFLEVEVAGQLITCPVTISGAFQSATFTKTRLTQIGSVTEAVIHSGSCLQGSATVLSATLPWRVEYSTYTGTLPLLTSLGLEVIGAGIQGRSSSGTTCLLSSSSAYPWLLELAVERGGRVTSILSSGFLPVGGGFVCSFAGSASIVGTGFFTTNGGGNVTVRLI